MSPKEKADEIYDKMRIFTEENIFLDHAKECSLITVEEVLLALDGNISLFKGRDSGYWRNVKSEIEKL